MRRRNIRKADFLRYIESEMALEKLRELRTRKLRDRNKRKSDRSKSPSAAVAATSKDEKVGDKHIVQHIHSLFNRVLRKFKGDVALHLQHAAFAKESRSFEKISRIYLQALQVSVYRQGHAH